MSEQERIVLCEGYHDRAFWRGALEHFGCIDRGAIAGGGRKPVLDLSGRVVARGNFGLYTPSGHFVRVRPCGGDRSLVLAELKTLLQRLATQPIERFIVNIDDDGDVRTDNKRNSFPEAVRNATASVAAGVIEDANGDLIFGETRVSATAWWTGEAHSPALPWKQTLERMVAAALDAAYPGRGMVVGQWLAGTPGKDGSKPHAWSHMAGWYADHGCEGFYRFVWNDPAVVTQLKTRLEGCGVLRLMQEIAS